MKSTLEQDGSRVGKVVVHAATIAVSVVIALLALEFSLRFFYPGLGSLQTIVTHATSNDSRTYRLKPDVSARFAGLYQRLNPPVLWQVNSDGLRSDRSTPPRTSRFRIATFGDSEAFGWSVPIESTLQRQMERIDGEVDVINLGVPGYNIENVADHMAEWLPKLRPDIVFYWFHKNDLDPPLSYSPVLAQSQLYILYRKAHTSMMRSLFPGRIRAKDGPAAVAHFAAQIRRMRAIAGRHGTALIVGFPAERFVDPLRKEMHLTCVRSDDLRDCKAEPSPDFRIISVEPSQAPKWRLLPTVDGHLTHNGHSKTAASLCHVIASGLVRRCRPPASQ